MTLMHFTWHELHTRDRARAVAFYRELCGWSVRDVTGTGGEPVTLCARAGRELAAVVTSKAPPQVPSFWLPYLSAGELDATVARAVELGARVLRPAMDVPGAGRSATVFDPRGALVGLRAGDAAAPDGDAAFVWNQLLTDDPAAAAGFYAALGGLTCELVDVGAAGEQRLLVRDGRPVAGVMRHPAQAHPHWLPYLGAADPDEATRRALALGATPFLPAQDAPGFGRFSAVDDPTGAGLCLLRRSSEARSR